VVIVKYDAVPSEFVPLAILQRRLMSAKNHEEEKIIRGKMMALLEVRYIHVLKNVLV